MPTIREFLLSELSHEINRSRETLEQMPEGIAMIVTRPDLDLA